MANSWIEEAAKSLGASYGKDEPGIKTTHWFWGADADFGPVTKKPAEAVYSEPALERVKAMMLETPDISGATLLNWIASQGMKVDYADGVVPEVKGQKEADNSSSQGVGILAESSKALVKGGLIFNESFKFLEGSSAKDDGIGPTVFKVALIQEGLGNLRDAFYYTKQCLEKSVPVFEGKKCYADHPSADEEQTRPERSVRDVVGHFENVRVEESADGSTMLVGDLVMLADKPYEWARALVRHAVGYSSKFPDKQFIGLSINAAGDADPTSIDEFLKSSEIPDSAKPKLTLAASEGITQLRVVSEITEAISCDLVTEPGAKGRVMEILEGAKRKESEMEKHEAKQEEAKQEEAKQEDMPSDEGHDDPAKDKELIMAMLKKHLGDEEVSDEAVGKAKEAYEAYKEMGYKEEEAGEAMGHAMKLAKHMSGKEAKEAEPMKDEKSADDECKEEEGKKESATILKLKGELAALKEAHGKRELADHIEKVLSESKLPRSITKQIKESLGKNASKKTFEDTYKAFMEGYKAGGARSEATISFAIEPEKTAQVRESSQKAIDFTKAFND